MAANRIVLGVSATLITIFVLLGFFMPGAMHQTLDATKDWITRNLGCCRLKPRHA